MSTCRLQAQDRRSFQSPAFRSLQAQPCGSREPRWGPRGSCDPRHQLRRGPGRDQARAAGPVGWAVSPFFPRRGRLCCGVPGQRGGRICPDSGRQGWGSTGGALRAQYRDKKAQAGQTNPEGMESLKPGSPERRDGTARAPVTHPRWPWAFQLLLGKYRGAGHALESLSLSFP